MLTLDCYKVLLSRGRGASFGLIAGYVIGHYSETSGCISPNSVLFQLFAAGHIRFFPASPVAYLPKLKWMGGVVFLVWMQPKENPDGWQGIQQGQEQHARQGTQCNSMQLQRVSWQSMIWMLAPFVQTCLSGWPSMSSTPCSKAGMVQFTSFLTWICLPLV